MVTTVILGPSMCGRGSDLKLLPPFPEDPLDPLDPEDPVKNSKNKVFLEWVVSLGPDRRSRVMFF